MMKFDPYANANEALLCISRFANAVSYGRFGIVWCDSHACVILRKPNFDLDGFGYALVVERSGNVTPPLPPPPTDPNIFDRLVDSFLDMAEASSRLDAEDKEIEEKNGREIDQDIQDVSEFFADKKVEHRIGLAIDVISIAAAFVPGVGEVELAAIGAVRAVRYLSEAAKLGRAAMKGSALVGGFMSAAVDGKYVYLSDWKNDEAGANEWDESPLAARLAIAGAMLAIQDWAVELPLTWSKLLQLRAAGKAAASARKMANIERARKLEKSERLIAGNLGKASVAAKSARLKKRAEALAEKAREANIRAIKYQQELAGKLLEIGGPPITAAYAMHDYYNPVAPKWLGSLLQPSSNRYPSKDRKKENLSVRVIAISRTPSGAR